MQLRKELETGRFTAVSERGTLVTIIETTTYIEVSSSEGTEWVEGLKRYTTAQGDRLNVTGQRTFESPLMGTTYHRV